MDDDFANIPNEFELDNGVRYRVTPLGHMALVLKDEGFSFEEAGRVAQLMNDRIFHGGYTYVHSSQLTGEFTVPDSLEDEE